MADDATMLYVNGMNGTRGGYLVPPLSPDEALKLAVADEKGRGDHLEELRRGRGGTASPASSSTSGSTCATSHRRGGE